MRLLEKIVIIVCSQDLGRAGKADGGASRVKEDTPFCLSEMSFKPILDNIHLEEHCTHVTSVEYELLLFLFFFFFCGGNDFGFLFGLLLL